MSFFSPAPNALSKANDLPATAPYDDLVKIFNTALVATRASNSRDFGTEFSSLMNSPAFRAVIGAVRQHARTECISEKLAAEQVIEVFRKIDSCWSDFVFQEGVERLRSPVS